MAAGAINSRSLFVPCSISSKRSQYSPQETQTSLCASSSEVSYYTLETSEPESIWSPARDGTELAEGLPTRALVPVSAPAGNDSQLFLPIPKQVKFSSLTFFYFADFFSLKKDLDSFLLCSTYPHPSTRGVGLLRAL